MLWRNSIPLSDGLYFVKTPHINWTQVHVQGPVRKALETLRNNGEDFEISDNPNQIGMFGTGEIKDKTPKAPPNNPYRDAALKPFTEAERACIR